MEAVCGQEVGSIGGHTPVGSTQGQKPDIIDCCLVSTLNLPLVQKNEVVTSVPKDPHYGVRITLNIDFESVVSRQLIGKISKRRNRSTRALREG